MLQLQAHLLLPLLLLLQQLRVQAQALLLQGHPPSKHQSSQQREQQQLEGEVVQLPQLPAALPLLPLLSLAQSCGGGGQAAWVLTFSLLGQLELQGVLQAPP